MEVWGTGKPKREFLFSDDLADACVFVMEKWAPDKKILPLLADGKPLYFLNVGTGLEISIKDLSELISNEVGFKGRIIWDKTKPDGTPRKKLDTTKINDLGWMAKTNLNEGIELTLKHFKNEVLNLSLRE